MLDLIRPVPLRGKGRLLDPVTPRSGRKNARVWGEYRMDLDLANVIHRQIYMGCFGREMTDWARALLRPGGRFVDVGAHAGYFSLLAADRVGKNGRVYAVEPNPAVFATLQGHLRGNLVSQVSAHQIALGADSGTLTLYTPPDAEARDYNVTCMPRPGWNRVDVRSEPLDAVLSEWNVERVDLMKVDVEGAEPLVLAGGRDALRSGIVRHLMIEVNGPRLTEGGSSPANLVETLLELGFRPARLSGSRALAVSREELDVDPTSEYDRLFVFGDAG